MGWLKRKLRRWLGVDDDVRSAVAILAKAERVAELVHGAADLHATHMENWAVFVIRGRGAQQTDMVKVVDLSHIQYPELRAWLKSLDMGRRQHIDAPRHLWEAIRL